jgi:hypothetical protein
MPESPQPVGREKAHPLALRLFTILRDRSDEDRRLVFEVLAERLGHSSSDLKREVIDALEAYRAETGRLPTVERYKRWRRESPRGRCAPSVSQIRSRFGAWNDAVCAMPSVPAADPTATRLRSAGRRFSREEVINALREFGASLPPGTDPTVTRYRAWATEQGGKGLRVPTSDAITRRIFRTWLEALAAAGVEYPDQTQVWVRRASAFTAADAERALRDFWAECGPPATCSRYDLWSQRRDADSGPTPRSATVARCYGGWKRGVEEVLGPHARRNGGKSPTYAEAELWAALHRCMADLGHPPRQAEYDAWRLHQADRCPSGPTLAKFLGSGTWRGLLAAIERQGNGR